MRIFSRLFGLFDAEVGDTGDVVFLRQRSFGEGAAEEWAR